MKKVNEANPVIGDIEKVQGTEVTVSNPDGTKTIAPTSMLSKDANGKLTLNKSVAQQRTMNSAPANMQQQQQGQQQQQPLQVKPGEKINVVADDINTITALAGMKKK